MFDNPVINSSIDVTEGCPMKAEVHGSDMMRLLLGTAANSFEMQFDAGSLREFTRLSVEALTDMDDRFSREQAEKALAYRETRAGQ